MSYEDILEHMERKIAYGKEKKTLTAGEVKVVVDQWVDNRPEEDLNEEVAKKEIKKLEDKLKRYNVSPVGHMDKEKEEGRCRIL